MMKKIVTAVALASTAGFATVAVAQPANMSGIKPEGFYLETNLGYGKTGKLTAGTNCTSSPNADCLSSVKNKGFVYNITAGYKLIQYVAVDVGLWGYPKDEVEGYRVGGGDLHSSKDTPYLGVLSLKGIIPIADDFSVFAKAGLGYYYLNHTGEVSHAQFVNKNNPLWVVSDVKSKQHGLVAAFGIGAEYNISESAYVGLGFNYVPDRDSKNLPRLMSGTVNLGYIF